MASSAFRFIVLVAAVALASCRNDMKVVQMFDRQTPPDQELQQAHIVRSERGMLQMELDAPLIRQYSTPAARTVYPMGLEVRFYNAERQVRTYLRANQARSLDDRKMMEAKDSVVVIDFTNGDTVYLQDIIWNQNEDRIYSNHPLRAVNGQRVTYGDGFVSDSRMEHMRILRQRGTIEFQE